MESYCNTPTHSSLHTHLYSYTFTHSTLTFSLSDALVYQCLCVSLYSRLCVHKQPLPNTMNQHSGPARGDSPADPAEVESRDSQTEAAGPGEYFLPLLSHRPSCTRRWAGQLCQHESVFGVNDKKCFFQFVCVPRQCIL